VAEQVIIIILVIITFALSCKIPKSKQSLKTKRRR